MKKILVMLCVAMIAVVLLSACHRTPTRIVINEENITNTIVFRRLSSSVFGLGMVVQELDKDGVPHISFCYLNGDNKTSDWRTVKDESITGKKVVLCSGNYQDGGYQSIIYKTDDGYRAVNYELGMMSWELKTATSISKEDATLDNQIALAKERLTSDVDYLNYGAFKGVDEDENNYFYLVTTNLIEIYNDDTLELLKTFNYDVAIYGVKTYAGSLVVACADGEQSYKIERKSIFS